MRGREDRGGRGPPRTNRVQCRRSPDGAAGRTHGAPALGKASGHRPGAAEGLDQAPGPGQAVCGGSDRAGGRQAGRGAEKTTGAAFFRKWSAVPRSSEASRECGVSRRGARGGGCAQRIPSRSGSAATVTAANCLSGLSAETLTGARLGARGPPCPPGPCLTRGPRPCGAACGQVLTDPSGL